jgi:hypothetical protein
MSKKNFPNKFYVYQLRDPREELPFYIGKGSGYRAWSHLKNHRHSTNTLKKDFINKLLKQNIIPVVELLHDNLEEEEAFKLEIEYIEKFGRKIAGEGCLLNICKGGDGIHGVWDDENHRDHISSSMKKVWLNPEHKEHVSLINKKYWSDPEYKDRLKKSMVESIKNRGVWNSGNSTPKTKEVWSKADLIMKLVDVKSTTIENLLGFSESEKQVINAIRRRIKKGWNPLEDSSWLRDFHPNSIPDSWQIEVKKSLIKWTPLDWNEVRKENYTAPWDTAKANDASLLAWSYADVFVYFPGLGPQRITNEFNLPKTCIPTLKNIKHKFIDKKWNPIEDKGWLHYFKKSKPLV